MRLLIATATIMLFSSTAFAAGLLPDRVEQAIADRVAAGQYRAVAVGFVDGDNVEVKSWGKFADGRPVTGDTVFEIGSVTKTFTATLLAKAVVDGTARLDEPLSALVPDWTVPGGSRKQITLEDIAIQRSGLPRLPTNLAPKDQANPYADYDVAKLKAFLADYRLPREPGEKYEYSNLAFGLLGTALAAAAHKPYSALVDDAILTPLGMTHSSAAGRISPDLIAGVGGDAKPVKNWDFDAIAGAGAVRSSANDMLRFLKAAMHPDTSPLGRAMALAETPRADTDGDFRIGLAWMTGSAKPIVWHNGMTGGYAAFLGFTADRKRGVVILTNTAVSVDDLGFAALVPGTPLADAQKAIDLPDAALDEVSGEFKLTDAFSIRVFRAGHQLYIQATGQGPVPVYASARDAFFARLVPASISFVRDGSGKIVGGVLHQNGDHPLTRLPDKQTVAIDAAVLKDYAGSYQLGPNIAAEVVVKDGRLFVQLTGQESFEVYPRAKDKFFYKVVEAELTFEREASGKVVAVVLHQNGRDLRAPKK